MTRHMHLDHYMAIVGALIDSGNKPPDALERAERIHEAFSGFGATRTWRPPSRRTSNTAPPLSSFSFLS